MKSTFVCRVGGSLKVEIILGVLDPGPNRLDLERLSQFDIS